MKFNVRIREIIFYDLVVEAQSLKEAFSIATKQVGEQLPAELIIGVRYEVESVTCVSEA